MQEVILVHFHNRHVMWISIYSNVPDYVVGRFPTWARKKNQPQVFFFQAETPLIICKESTLVAIISKSKEQCHSKARSCPFGAIPPKIAEAWVKKAEVLKAQLEYATAVQEVPTGRSRDTGLGVGGAQGGLIFFFRGISFWVVVGHFGTFWWYFV